MKKYFKTIIKNRKERVASLTMDISFFNMKLHKLGDEQILRDKFAELQSTIEKKTQEHILACKIAKKQKEGKLDALDTSEETKTTKEIEDLVDRIVAIKKALKEYKQLKSDTEDYLEYIQSNLPTLKDRLKKYF